MAILGHCFEILAMPPMVGEILIGYCSQSRFQVHKILRDRTTGLLTSTQAQDLTQRIIGISSADQTRVNITHERRSNTRFALNRITTSGESEDLQITVTCTFGRRRAAITTNRIDAEGLAKAVEKAEEMARLSPDDPELVPELLPQELLEIEGFFESTAHLDARGRADVAASAIEAVSAVGDLSAFGFLDVRAQVTAVANTEGLFGYHPSTWVSYALTVRTDDGRGSGWDRAGHRDWSAVRAQSVHENAIRRALNSQGPRKLEPGQYTVVLTPHAVSSLVGLLAGALNARSADEGRSAFSAARGGNRRGETIIDHRLSLTSDPAALGSAPFESDGLARRRTMWIESGVLQNLQTSRYWALRSGLRPTGSSSSLVLDVDGLTDRNLDRIVASTERGLLVTRLHYIRSIDPRTITYTGLTRDGVLMIEDGKVAYPVNNFRWNDSPLFVLNRIDALGSPERVSASRVVPAIRARNFNFTSISEAV